jgi:hypothetical protein
MITFKNNEFALSIIRFSLQGQHHTKAASTHLTLTRNDDLN